MTERDARPPYVMASFTPAELDELLARDTAILQTREDLTIEEYRGYVERTTTERDFQNVVRGFAALHGWHHIYHTYDSQRSDPGFPDLVMVRGDVVLFVELKTQKGKVRPEQESWGQALVQVEGAAGKHVKYRIWRPSDWPQIVETLA
jgi:hypothetical protein